VGLRHGVRHIPPVPDELQHPHLVPEERLIARRQPRQSATEDERKDHGEGGLADHAAKLTANSTLNRHSSGLILDPAVKNEPSFSAPKVQPWTLSAPNSLKIRTASSLK